MLEHKFGSFEVKADQTSDDFLSIAGYGAVFGNRDDGGDIVLPGAFKERLAKGRKIKMLWQHDPNNPIGVWDEMREDDNGLYMSGRVSRKASKGAEVAALVEMGAIEGLSIGYKTNDYDRDEMGNRRLKSLDLWETSVVTFPMNELANIYSAKTDDIGKRDIERVFRDLGFSGSMAKAMAAGAQERRENVLREAGVSLPEADQREVDELKQLLTETLQRMQT